MTIIDPKNRPGNLAGFTLLELMVSVALVLVIILGVNQVFSLTSQTIGAGNTLTAIQRDNRAAQAVIYQDLRGAAISDGPFLVIRSQAMYAYRNQSDLDADTDGEIRTLDTGTGTELPLPLTALTDRTHRIDRISFFARDVFRRQTGNDGAFAADQASNEAHIWYGHLKRADRTFTSKNFQDPNNGAIAPADNPNNFFATQWILGRSAMLMVEPDSNGRILNRFGQPQNFYPHQLTPNNNLSPFDQTVLATDGVSRFHFGRYDLIGTSIDRFQRILAAAYPSVQGVWWDDVSSFRFIGESIIPRPISSEYSSWSVPIFVPGCTQFAVEYAGDFMSQDENGVPLPNPELPTNDPNLFTRPDGKIDFVVLNGGRKVRWYGFPRDTNDDGIMDSRDVFPFILITGQSRAPLWERNVVSNNYAKLEGNAYCVAWGPDTHGIPRPSMLRFTLTMDDTRVGAARVGTGLTFEYVVAVR